MATLAAPRVEDAVLWSGFDRTRETLVGLVGTNSIYHDDYTINFPRTVPRTDQRRANRQSYVHANQSAKTLLLREKHFLMKPLQALGSLCVKEIMSDTVKIV